MPSRVELAVQCGPYRSDSGAAALSAHPQAGLSTQVRDSGVEAAPT